jgi:hypothetical protein
VASPQAISVEPAAIPGRLANSDDVIALTSAATTRNAPGLRAVELGSPGEVTLSLCAATSNSKAEAVIRWAASDEGQRSIRQRFSGLDHSEPTVALDHH